MAINHDPPDASAAAAMPANAAGKRSLDLPGNLEVRVRLASGRIDTFTRSPEQTISSLCTDVLNAYSLELPPELFGVRKTHLPNASSAVAAPKPAKRAAVAVATKPSAPVFLDAGATIGSLLVDGNVPELLFLLRVGPARAEAAVMAAYAILRGIAATCEQRGRMWHLLRTLFLPASDISKAGTKRGQAALAKQLGLWSPDRVAYELVACTQKPRSQTRMALHCDFGILTEDIIVRLALAHVAMACAAAGTALMAAQHCLQHWCIGLTFRAHESASPDRLACIPVSPTVEALFACEESTTVTYSSEVCAFGMQSLPCLRASSLFVIRVLFRTAGCPRQGNTKSYCTSEMRASPSS